jgi:hypothetical protein
MAHADPSHRWRRCLSSTNRRREDMIAQQSADQFFGAVETHPNGKGENR